MLVKTFAGAVQGVESQTITIEVNAGGIPQQGMKPYFLVGLPDNAVREGWQRIEAALKNANSNCSTCSKKPIRPAVRIR